MPSQEASPLRRRRSNFDKAGVGAASAAKMAEKAKGVEDAKVKEAAKIAGKAAKAQEALNKKESAAADKAAKKLAADGQKEAAKQAKLDKAADAQNLRAQNLRAQNQAGADEMKRRLTLQKVDRDEKKLSAVPKTPRLAFDDGDGYLEEWEEANDEGRRQHEMALADSAQVSNPDAEIVESALSGFSSRSSVSARSTDAPATPVIEETVLRRGGVEVTEIRHDSAAALGGDFDREREVLKEVKFSKGYVVGAELAKVVRDWSHYDRRMLNVVKNEMIVIEGVAGCPTFSNEHLDCEVEVDDYYGGEGCRYHGTQLRSLDPSREKFRIPPKRSLDDVAADIGLTLAELQQLMNGARQGRKTVGSICWEVLEFNDAATMCVFVPDRAGKGQEGQLAAVKVKWASQNVKEAHKLTVVQIEKNPGGTQPKVGGQVLLSNGKSFYNPGTVWLMATNPGADQGGLVSPKAIEGGVELQQRFSELAGDRLGHQ